MIADLAIKNEGDGQIVSIITSYIKDSKYKKPLTIILFSLLIVVLYTNLAIYIAGASEILSEYININPILLKLIFYVFAAFVAIFSLKILGIVEKYAIFTIFVVIIALAIGSILNIRNSLPTKLNEFKDLLSFFSVAMFAFAAFFSVPQVVEGLEKDEKKIKKSIFYGMLMNLAIMLIVIFGTLLSSIEIKEEAIVGWSSGIGTWAEIIGVSFTILAMLTTYWSISLALKDIVSETLKLNPKLCFIIASIPSLLLALIPSTGFLDFLNLTSGAVAILIAIFLVPIYHIANRNKESILKKFSNPIVEIIIMISYILMAIGSLV